MIRSEVTTKMPRRISNMMANAIVALAQAHQKREAVGREGKRFVKPGQILVVKKGVGRRQLRQQ
mgnify:CR=1 FL=1